MSTDSFRSTAALLAMFLGIATSRLATPQAMPQPAAQPPSLINTCLITSNVKQLTDFYARVLQLKPHASGDDYVEFPTTAGNLATFDARAQEKYVPGSAQPAQNKSSILEFKVADVDQEYQRLQSLIKTWVKSPTTQPWGTRSIDFRDPDGNLVNFFTRVKP
jgi:catechol 2,3-dioxygenase-like lactoylglutathione lyase family enzyme